MGREIKFRGKRIDNEGWVYGMPFIFPHTCTFVCPNAKGILEFFYEIDPETIGQFTGLKDKNGKDIYEGDLNQDGGYVFYNTDDASFVWQYLSDDVHAFENESEWCEIVGTIYDSSGSAEQT